MKFEKSTIYAFSTDGSTTKLLKRKKSKWTSKRRKHQTHRLNADQFKEHSTTLITFEFCTRIGATLLIRQKGSYAF